jgi:hypothetical protein
MCVEKLMGQPIIIMSFDPGSSAREVVEAHFMSLELARHMSGPVHHIVNLLDCGSGSRTIVSALVDLLRARAMQVPDRQLYTWVIAPESRESLRDQGLVVFASLDDAIVFIRQQLDSLAPV